MKFNSKLWMLAVALATVGCQDDLENGPVTGTEGVDGPQTYMTVTINSETVTKAPQGENGKPAGGEGEGTYLGTENEYKVSDVAVVLYRKSDGSAFSSTENFGKDYNLVAFGYSGTVGGMEASNEDEHQRQASVTIEIKESGLEFDNVEFGVIGIANLGSEKATALGDLIGVEGGLTDMNDLANYLQDVAWDGSAYEDGTGTDAANHFVMSSHFDTPETVVLRAGADANNAPTANIHVERLAAKVRINEPSATSTTETVDGRQFVYTVMDEYQTPAVAIAKVRLDEAAIVNKLESGTYLLKHISGTATSLSTIPGVENDLYLADEVWDNGSSANYVIDPWTRNKIAASVGGTVAPATITGQTATVNLSYENHFTNDAEEANQKDYDDFWGSLSSNSIKTLAYSEGTFAGPKLIAYTQENTTRANESLNGYSTGVLFKATYVPSALTAINAAGDSFEEEPVAAYSTFNAGSAAPDIDYLMVKEGAQWVAYKNYEAIWAKYCWDSQSTLVLDYDAFYNTNITTLSKQAYLASAISNGDLSLDPTGYAAYLNEQCEGVDTSEGATPVYFAAADGFENYCQANPRGYVNEEGEASIHVVENCVCYYPYWIRHANNDNEAEMGIMEFGIVRNNIYDLTVSKISGFGFAGSDRPDPEKPNEDDEIFFKVNLFVRDWVIRSNSGIIL